jgi:hypothetical protein
MAEVRQMGGKGRRAEQRVSKPAGRRISGAGKKRGGVGKTQQGDIGKTRKRRVKGYGVDRLRTAAERRMAESSEALAESLMSKALAGKLESVKILMKLAEEEKARREEEREEDAPRLSELLVGSVVKVGQMWDGHRWRRVPPSRILAERCASSDGLVDINEDLVRMNEDLDREDLDEAA